MDLMKELVSKYLNKEVLNVDIIANGYLSSAYKITTADKVYVLRTSKDAVSWYEYEWDVLRTYLISDAMFKRSYEFNWCNSYGVLFIDNAPYHLMDYVEWEILGISEYDDYKIVQVAKKIAILHSWWKETLKNLETEEFNRLYKRSIREYLTNHETILSLYDQEPLNDSLNSIKKKILNLMRTRYLWLIDDFDWSRVTTLHWDFWHSNIIFNGTNPIFIDFSRIPFGEPGIDIGHFIVNLEIEYMLTWNCKYLNWKKLFLDTYIEFSGDSDISSYLLFSVYHISSLILSDKIQWFVCWTDDQKLKLIKYYWF